MKNILLITYDWAPGRTQLMPWRTIFEVAARMRTKGINATILSINKRTKNEQCKLYEDNNVPVVISNNLHINPDQLCEHPVHGSAVPDIVFFPITWKSAFKGNKRWPKLATPTIAYHGSAHYRLIDIARSYRYMTLRELFPYVLDATVPTKVLVNALKNRAINGVICMTNYNKNKLVENGWPDALISTIPPGINKEEKSNTPISENFTSLFKKNNPTFVFIGNALPIRGFETLIDAVQIVLKRNTRIKIICLVRSDPGNELALNKKILIKKLSGEIIRKHFFIIKRNCSRDEIQFAIKHSLAVVMPFLLVPSEIPLGILETMKEGGVVITTNSGGTSSFVGKSGLIASPADPKSLSNQILLLLQNTDLEQKKRLLALHKMQSHPNWDEVGDMWIRFAKHCLNLKTYLHEK